MWSIPGVGETSSGDFIFISEQTQLMGPGMYEAKDFIAISNQKPSSSRGICQTGESRFSRENMFLSSVPGPGTYGKGGVPEAALEEKCKESPSTVGMMDCVGREYFQGQAEKVGSGLAPCRYSFKDSTDQMLDRQVSTRGPYDLFSGDRYRMPPHIVSGCGGGCGLVSDYTLVFFLDGDEVHWPWEVRYQVYH